MKPTDSADAPDPRIAEVAADWLARHDAGLTAAEEQEFAGWLAADPRHAAAWQEISAAWATFDEPRLLGQADDLVRELAARQNRRRWRVVYGGLAAGLAAAAAVVILLVAQPRPIEEVFLKGKHQVLEDGSRVELNDGAEIAVRYSATRRDVRLLRGEALFTVAKNPERPFVVTTGRIEARAVGTAFALQLAETEVDLLVTEGRVAVRWLGEGPGSEPVLVSAGDRLLMPHDRSAAPRLRTVAQNPEQIEQRLAWRGLRLELSATTLSEIIALLNAQSHVQLVLDDPALGAMRLSGIFRADNAEGFVRLLEANYGVEAERRGPTEIILRRK